MGKSYYIYNDGILKRKDNTLRFETNDGQKRDLPITQIDDIYMMSQSSINTSLLSLLSNYGIPIHFFGYYDNYLGSFYPKEEILSGNMTVKQVEHYENDIKRLTLAKAFVKAAAANIYRNLRYYNGRGKNLTLQMENINTLRVGIEKACSIKELMGIEGNIRKEYYSAWNIIIGPDLEFSKRVMRPPDNEINTLISFVNSMIYARTLTEIYHTQLNPTISYLHEPSTRRFSLCLDISEIFKPIIGDRLIFSLINKKQITKDSFTPDLNGLHLKKEASQKVVRELDKILNKTIHHSVLDRDVSYHYLIRLECYKLMKHLIGEKEYEGLELWW